MTVIRSKMAGSDNDLPNHFEAVDDNAPASAPGGEPPPPDSPLPVEFREGGYGWYVTPCILIQGSPSFSSSSLHASSSRRD